MRCRPMRRNNYFTLGLSLLPFPESFKEMIEVMKKEQFTQKVE